MIKIYGELLKEKRKKKLLPYGISISVWLNKALLITHPWANGNYCVTFSLLMFTMFECLDCHYMVLSGGQFIFVRVSSEGWMDSGDDRGGIKCHINQSVLL